MRQFKKNNSFRDPSPLWAQDDFGKVLRLLNIYKFCCIVIFLCGVFLAKPVWSRDIVRNNVIPAPSQSSFPRKRESRTGLTPAGIQDGINSSDHSDEINLDPRFRGGDISFAQTNKINALVNQIHQQYGLNILYKNIPRLQQAKVAYHLADPADYPFVIKFLEILKTELKKYPPDFFKKFSQPTIILVKKYFYEEKPAEGLCTFAGNVIFFDFFRSRRNDRNQEHSIHHEIFHMIEVQMKKENAVFDAVWQQFNSPNFEYGKPVARQGNVNALNYFAPSDPGFVTEYAMTSPAEDKAEVFACLMVDSQRRLIEQWTKKDEILQKKVDYIKSIVRRFCEKMIVILIPPKAKEGLT